MNVAFLCFLFVLFPKKICTYVISTDEWPTKYCSLRSLIKRALMDENANSSSSQVSAIIPKEWICLNLYYSSIIHDVGYSIMPKAKKRFTSLNSDYNALKIKSFSPNLFYLNCKFTFFNFGFCSFFFEKVHVVLLLTYHSRKTIYMKCWKKQDQC
jgi:hypothetical protein